MVREEDVVANADNSCFHVVIIGAGVAGLACAKTLLENYHLPVTNDGKDGNEEAATATAMATTTTTMVDPIRITIVEASDDIGGRVKAACSYSTSTTSLSAGNNAMAATTTKTPGPRTMKKDIIKALNLPPNHIVDLGAETIHCRDHILWHVIQDLYYNKKCWPQFFDKESNKSPFSSHTQHNDDEDGDFEEDLFLENVFTLAHGDGGPDDEPTPNRGMYGMYYLTEFDELVMYDDPQVQELSTMLDVIFLSPSSSSSSSTSCEDDDTDRNELHQSNGKQEVIMSSLGQALDEQFRNGKWKFNDDVSMREQERQRQQQNKVTMMLHNLAISSYGNTAGCCDLYTLSIHQLKAFEEYWESNEVEGDYRLSSTVGMYGIIRAYYEEYIVKVVQELEKKQRHQQRQRQEGAQMGQNDDIHQDLNHNQPTQPLSKYTSSQPLFQVILNCAVEQLLQCHCEKLPASNNETVPSTVNPSYDTDNQKKFENDGKDGKTNSCRSNNDTRISDDQNKVESRTSSTKRVQVHCISTDASHKDSDLTNIAVPSATTDPSTTEATNTEPTTSLFPNSSPFVLQADAVVVTVPPPMIPSLFETNTSPSSSSSSSSSSSQLISLPIEKEVALQKYIGFERCVKVITHFSKRLWPKQLQTIIATNEDIPEFWFRHMIHDNNHDNHKLSGENAKLESSSSSSSYLSVGYLMSTNADRLVEKINQIEKRQQEQASSASSSSSSSPAYSNNQDGNDNKNSKTKKPFYSPIAEIVINQMSKMLKSKISKKYTETQEGEDDDDNNNDEDQKRDDEESISSLFWNVHLGTVLYDWKVECPYIQGGYMYPKVGIQHQQHIQDIARPMWKESIFWAGEATNTNACCTVQAAMETGIRAAHEVLTQKGRKEQIEKAEKGTMQPDTKEVD